MASLSDRKGAGVGVGKNYQYYFDLVGWGTWLRRKGVCVYLAPLGSLRARPRRVLG